MDRRTALLLVLSAPYGFAMQDDKKTKRFSTPETSEALTQGLSLSDVASPPTYVSVTQVRSITGPTVKPKIVDVTAYKLQRYTTH